MLIWKVPEVTSLNVGEDVVAQFSLAVAGGSVLPDYQLRALLEGREGGGRLVA